MLEHNLRLLSMTVAQTRSASVAETGTRLLGRYARTPIRNMLPARHYLTSSSFHQSRRERPFVFFFEDRFPWLNKPTSELVYIKP